MVHTIADLSRSSGGPSRSVPSLCAALQNQGIGTTLAYVDFAGAEAVEELHGVEYLSSPGWRLRHLRQVVSPRFGDMVEGELRSSDEILLHDHGIWQCTNHQAVRAAARAGRPIVVSPRGMLSGWALEQNAHVKNLAWWSYQFSDLQKAVVLHATSELEARELRARGLTAPIAIVPNGVDLPKLGSSAGEAGYRTALFLSRIHRKKGLDLLLEAWDLLRPAGWKLTISGPGEQTYRDQISRMVVSRGLQDCVSVTGGVYGVHKRELFLKSELFVLPTHSENFGIVIAEALAHGLPVVTTVGAPWEDLREHDCGWWIDIGRLPLVEALREATSAPPERLAQMGARGRDLVATKYTWEAAARAMGRVYEWILAGGAHPEALVHPANGPLYS